MKFALSGILVALLCGCEETISVTSDSPVAERLAARSFGRPNVPISLVREWETQLARLESKSGLPRARVSGLIMKAHEQLRRRGKPRSLMSIARAADRSSTAEQLAKSDGLEDPSLAFHFVFLVQRETDGEPNPVLDLTAKTPDEGFPELD